MERLTFEGNFCDIAMCRENPCPYNGSCTQREVWEKLKAYEDTGMEPEEIKPKRGLPPVVGAALEAKADHMRNLLKAEREGRLVVLPCKVGERVFVTAAYGKTFDVPVEGYVDQFVLHDDDIMFLEARIWADFGEGKKKYGFSTSSFWKTVHLTRAAEEV